MSDGQPHPNASAISIPNCGREGWVGGVTSVNVTSSRLAITIQTTDGLHDFADPAFHHLVWDWKTGVKYAVSSFKAH